MRNDMQVCTPQAYIMHSSIRLFCVWVETEMAVMFSLCVLGIVA